MKVEGVFLVVELAVMVHEQMKPYKEVVVVVDVVVLRSSLFLVFEKKQVIFFFFYINQLRTISIFFLPIFSISISLEVTRLIGRHGGGGGEKLYE
jgi:hypothetical protein